MKKTCTRCEKELAICEFPIINKKINKISSKCITCKREYDREYWGNNKNEKSENKNEKRQINRLSKRKFIVDLLKKSKCLDCELNDWRVLEFDHRDRETKSFNIADAAHYSLKKIQLEIDKCDIVCANCHTLRTIKQRGYYKF